METPPLHEKARELHIEAIERKRLVVHELYKLGYDDAENGERLEDFPLIELEAVYENEKARRGKVL